MTAVSDAVATRLAGDQSLRAGISEAESKLGQSGVQSPRHDAEMIAAHLLGVPRSELWRHIDGAVPPGFYDLVARRAVRVPLQHITGTAYFRHATLTVGPGVFIPRPETEIVVEEAIRLLREMRTPAPVVVDLCSGSGAIALSVATECTEAIVYAVEVDPGAAPWLRQNVLEAGVHVHAADMHQCLPELEGRVDLVIANPPYIPVDSIPCDVEVARYDPEVSLYSGEDGLDHIRIVEQNAARLLRSGGWVVVEHADKQGSSAPSVFAAEAAWMSVRDHLDLTGRDRFLTAQRAQRLEGH
jgi:release factor glutamine methyltransferase